jgi:hypothetical protein
MSASYVVNARQVHTLTIAFRLGAIFLAGEVVAWVVDISDGTRTEAMAEKPSTPRPAPKREPVRPSPMQDETRGLGRPPHTA